jgi:hypothetical protein
LKFGDLVDSIYPIVLEKDTTDTARPASYLDLHLEIDSEGWLRTKLYHKRDDFNFPIVNLICSNIPAEPAYEVTLSSYDMPTLVVLIMISLGLLPITGVQIFDCH